MTSYQFEIFGWTQKHWVEQLQKKHILYEASFVLSDLSCQFEKNYPLLQK